MSTKEKPKPHPLCHFCKKRHEVQTEPVITKKGITKYKVICKKYSNEMEASVGLNETYEFRRSKKR